VKTFVNRPAEAALRRLAACLGAVILSTALLAGCGGESSAEDSPPGTSAEDEPGDSAKKKASGDGLPEDFPDDVPLPEFTSAKKIGGESGPDVDSDWWSILLMLKSPTETPVEDYAAQLSAAGYTVSTASGSTEAVGPQWEISIHSSMSNTVTVAVMSR